MSTQARTSSGRRVLVGVVALVGVAGALFAGLAIIDMTYYSTFVIPTAIMAPTIEPGAHVRTRPIDGRDVHAGDIVVLRRTLDGAPAQVVSRVVAVGGQSVANHEGRLWVDGRPASEPYLAPGTRTTTVKPLTVPRGAVYVLGDHREDEAGSDYFGPSPASAVERRVVDTDATSGWWLIAQLAIGGAVAVIAAVVLWRTRRPPGDSRGGEYQQASRPVDRS